MEFSNDAGGVVSDCVWALFGALAYTLTGLACWRQGVVFSYPVTTKNGEWSIKQGLPIDDFSAGKLKATGEELVEEKQLALQCLSE